RLLDYSMHDGCNARTWVHFEVKNGSGSDGATIPAGTKLLAGGPAGEVSVNSINLSKVLIEQNPQVFETKHDIKLLSEHNEITFYTWSDSECCLPKGATRATLLNNPALSLKPYDVLLLEEK